MSRVDGRDTSRDGFNNTLESTILTGLAPIWRFVQGVPALEQRANGLIINKAASKMPYRPEPFSTRSTFTSWASLTDKSFNSRHLPAQSTPADLPAADDVADLLVRHDGEFHECPKSTVCFAYFAEWFTDGFLRSDRNEPPDHRKNDCNQDIDLMQLYGLTESVTNQLREHAGGRLKSQVINGEEYPPFAYDADGQKKPEFSAVPDVPSKLRPDFTPAELATFFAVGSDTANLQLGFVMMNVLFFREHNRIARALEAEYPTWDDERLFETARNVLIVLLLKIVVEEYINHIAPFHFRLKANPGSFKNPPWYRTNWIAGEFNLVYRWHQLVPPTLRAGGRDLSVHETLYNTTTLTEHGLGMLMQEASAQRAGRIGPYNTDPDMRQVQIWSIEKARALDLAPYNDYRELCGFPRVTAFDQISGNPRVQQHLKELYGTVDRIEYYAGLFTEDLAVKAMLPALIGRLVGIDAFSQAFTNPLLAPRVFNEATFSPLGMKIIRETDTISQIMHRSLPAGQQWEVRMTRAGWTRPKGKSAYS